MTGPVPSFIDNPSLGAFGIRGNELSGTLPDPPDSLYGANVCPNRFNPVPSAAWDSITRIHPWYRDCLPPPDAIYSDGFDG